MLATNNTTDKEQKCKPFCVVKECTVLKVLILEIVTLSSFGRLILIYLTRNRTLGRKYLESVDDAKQTMAMQ